MTDPALPYVIAFSVIAGTIVAYLLWPRKR